MSRSEEIEKLHQTFCVGLRKTLQTAIQIGELLVAQKKECGHGSWIPWIKANLSFDQRTARQYMSCFMNREKLNRYPNTDLTLIEAARVSAKPTKEEEVPVELQEAVSRREISKPVAERIAKLPKEEQVRIVEQHRELKTKKLQKNEAAKVRRSTRGLTDSEKDSGFANYIFDGKQFLVSPLYSELENKDRGHLRMAGSETHESRLLCADWDAYHEFKIRDKIIKAIEPLLNVEVPALWEGKKPGFTVARDFGRAKDRRRIIDMVCSDFEHMAVVLEQMETRRVEKGLDPQVPPHDMVPRPKKTQKRTVNSSDGVMAKLLREFSQKPLTANEAAEIVAADRDSIESCRKRVPELRQAGFIKSSGERRNGGTIWQITEAGEKTIGL
jgi:hypothetical protein